MAPILKTARLLLRPLEETDVASLTRILQEPEVARFWPAYDEARVRRELLTPDADLHVFALEQDATVVGLIQYSEGEDPDYPHAQLDLFLMHARWNQGLGPEAVNALCRYLFDERGHHRLTIDPAADNTRAHRAYVKAGFRAVGLLRHHQRLPDGTYRDGLLMERLASDDVPPSPAPSSPHAKVTLRRAGRDDVDVLLSMMDDFNELEVIPVDAPKLRAGVDQLVSRDDLGRAFLLQRDGQVAGYALLTFGFDLEFNGADAFLTELYVVPHARAGGVGRAALSLVEDEARKLGIAAVHLMVRPQNAPALRLYLSMGYQAAPRMVLTRWLNR